MSPAGASLAVTMPTQSAPTQTTTQTEPAAPSATTTASQQAVDGTAQIGAGAQTAAAAPAAPAKAPARTYTVAAGDTLSSIAKRAGLADFAQLYELNKDLIGPDPSKLKVGLQLRLPDGAKDPGAPTPTTTARHRGNGRGNNGNGLGNGGSSRGTGSNTGTTGGGGGGTTTTTTTTPAAPAAPTSNVRQIDGKSTATTADDTYGTFVDGHRVGLKMM